MDDCLPANTLPHDTRARNTDLSLHWRPSIKSNGALTSRIIMRKLGGGARVEAGRPRLLGSHIVLYLRSQPVSHVILGNVPILLHHKLNLHHYKCEKRLSGKYDNTARHT